jgi:hypothetical protein
MHDAKRRLASRESAQWEVARKRAIGRRAKARNRRSRESAQWEVAQKRAMEGRAKARSSR